MWITTGFAAIAAVIVTAVPASAAVRATPAALVFPAQGISTISPAQDVQVTHTPGRRISVTVAGAHPANFFVVRNGCQGDAAYLTAACTAISVRFAPSAAGARSAVLRLSGDGTRDVPLRGTGTAPAAPVPRIASTWSVRFRVTRRFTQFRMLRVGAVPSTATVALRCAGKGCPFKRRTLTSRNGRANGSAALRRAKLRPGATLEIRVTAPGAVGMVVRYRIRRGRTPVSSWLCLAPGTTTPARCKP
jgi:hypothetical protein